MNADKGGGTRMGKPPGGNGSSNRLTGELIKETGT